jgi:tryptophan 2,3-dioxygenase
MTGTDGEGGAANVERQAEEIHTDFSAEPGYTEFLQLDKVLAAQRPIKGSHDELLFVVIHQTTELWIKLMIHEIQAAIERIRADQISPALKMLARVSRVQEQITQSWSVLSTLTPVDYLEFRDGLGHASGFQSEQYRILEFSLGDKQAAVLAPHRSDDAATARLTTALHAPSLYDEVLRLVLRNGFAIAASQLERDLSQPYTPHSSVEAAWLAIYRDSDTHWRLYELAEKLVDIEDAFQQWRFRHMKTVRRIIGHKRGTGGSAGVDYLIKALERDFFPELISVRTSL